MANAVRTYISSDANTNGSHLIINSLPFEQITFGNVSSVSRIFLEVPFSAIMSAKSILIRTMPGWSSVFRFLILGTKYYFSI